jgi:hypothetical protein
MATTQYIYPTDDSWKVKTQGRASRVFKTQREAVSFAIDSGKKKIPSQVVVFGKNGRVVGHKRFGMAKVLNLRKKGQLDPKRITAAVSKVVLERLKADDALTA